MPALVGIALVLFFVGGPIVGTWNWASELSESDAQVLVWSCLGLAGLIAGRKVLVMFGRDKGPSFPQIMGFTITCLAWIYLGELYKEYERPAIALFAPVVPIFGLIVELFLAGIAESGRSGAGGPATVERGTEIMPAAEAQALLWPGRGPEDIALDQITLGGLTIPAHMEAQHFLFCGTTGSGKTQAIYRVLDAVNEREGRALIADAGGVHWSRGFAPFPGTLLNPFDARSVDWSPFAEIRQDYDCARLAKSAIPDREGAGGEWNYYAQTLLAEILQVMHRHGNSSTYQLLHYLTVADREQLAELLAGTPAAVLVGVGNDRMLGSVRSIIATYLAAWRHLPDEGSWSIRDWVKDGPNSGNLYLTYRDDQAALLRSLVAGWIDLAVVEALSLPEPVSDLPTLFFILDEVDSLGKVASLDSALAKLRKYGACCVLGCQTIAQLRKTYGRDTAQTVAANCGTKLVLRAGDNETAEYLSRELGEQEISRVTISTGESGKAGELLASSSSKQASVQRNKQAAVMPAELMALPDLEGYLSLAGIGGAVSVKLDYQDVPISRDAFEPLIPDNLETLQNAKNENGPETA